MIILHRAYLLTLLVLFVTAGSATAFEHEDKVLHFSVSTMLGAGAETYLHQTTDLNAYQRIGLGTFLGVMPGLAKEVIDSQKKDNYFSTGDMAANLGGSLVGALLGNWLNNKYWAQVEAGKERIGLTIGRSF